MGVVSLKQADSTKVGELAIRRLQPAIGAEISGVDLSRPLDDATRDAIKAAVLRHKVVFFRDQDITRDQQVAFAARFGPIYTHPTTAGVDKNPQVHGITAADFAKYEQERAAAAAKAGKAVTPYEDKYHTDTSWRLVPAWGAVLRGVTIPEVGGDTIWVDAEAAYNGLPEEVKRRLDGLHVTHDFREALNRAGKDYPIVAHPVARRHPETGATVLWVNYSQKPQILGVDLAESRELLDVILAQYKRPEYQVRFSWRPNSVAFWDNRAAVHYAVRNYGDFPRVVERVLIADQAHYADL
ncbi:TauD/TfdA dioxygenase family protein [Nitrospirillum sp. BR 11163]|uniref:TauD/TfdA dioxygenase family protein n=1 Tax=Nitrospirillum sp. BR 11163 TaxID=3104323 RepID=UPI002AFF3772|nr:TauD/TfdA family dioxygenase [Nitrospirillum sp. BR 11163]MEA1675238.1 TauD/TfdA family dioxygenase [Nitrospirillum sp. BR 11163]